MFSGANSFNVTTILLVAGALFVAYTRFQNSLDSNMPLIYYSVMVVYTNALEGRLSPWIIYTALALGLMLRFEFMSKAVTNLVKAVEFLVLGIIVYDCTAMVLQL